MSCICMSGNRRSRPRRAFETPEGHTVEYDEYGAVVGVELMGVRSAVDGGESFSSLGRLRKLRQVRCGRFWRRRRRADRRALRSTGVCLASLLWPHTVVGDETEICLRALDLMAGTVGGVKMWHCE
jgi:hypothetical protein